MGETSKAIFSSSQQGLAPLIDDAVPLTVEPPGGRIRIQWDYEAKATPNGQLAFFAEFLKTSGVYRKWVESCPLSYSSPNAPERLRRSGNSLRFSVASWSCAGHFQPGCW
jgi:hypothetical protein